MTVDKMFSYISCLRLNVGLGFVAAHSSVSLSEWNHWSIMSLHGVRLESLQVTVLAFQCSCWFFFPVDSFISM